LLSELRQGEFYSTSFPKEAEDPLGVNIIARA